MQLTNGDAIAAVNLSKRWRTWRRTVHALSDVTLRVPAGSAFGLLGPNGAGKTTFVKSVLGTLRPSTGSATVFGFKAGSRDAARLTGYVPESSAAPLHLTASQLLGLHATLCGVDAGERQRRIPELLERVGLREWTATPLGKFSRGMKQRAAIAAALVHRPRLLILDEPTDGLDPAGRRLLLDLLRSLNREQGVTLLINSHLLNEVEEVCDRVAILRNGRVVRQARVSKLRAPAGYTATLRAVPHELDTALRDRGFVTASESGGVLRLRVASREDVNWVIDQSRALGALLDSIGPATTNLESVYLAETQSESIR